jgi:hypothetical protein
MVEKQHYAIVPITEKLQINEHFRKFKSMERHRRQGENTWRCSEFLHGKYFRVKVEERATKMSTEIGWNDISIITYSWKPTARRERNGTA